MSYLAAVDAGASETKASLFDSGGNEIANARQDCPVESPTPGWAECSVDVLLQWPLLAPFAISVSRLHEVIDAAQAWALPSATATTPLAKRGTTLQTLP